MAECLHVATLYQSDVLSVTDVRCRPRDSCRGAEEQVTTNDIVFPRAGIFVRHFGRKQSTADANQVLFFRRLEPYRVSHPAGGGDDCTVLTFAPQILTDAFAACDPSVRDHPADPFATSQALSGSATILLLQRLLSRLDHTDRRGADVDLLAADETALQLLDAVAGDIARITGGAMDRRRPQTSAAHRSLAENTRIVLSQCLAAPQTLGDIARRVHSSPFHLARVFRRVVGLPIHKYLTRLRLRAALEHLNGEQRTLTELALSLGFSSHSHFSHAFRREFGLPPRTVRERRN